MTSPLKTWKPRCLLALAGLCFLIAADGLLAAPDAPPRDVPLVEKKLDALANRDFDALGKAALEMAPTKWKHAESENFIVHFRRVTEAKPVLREIEFTLWFVAKTLGADKARYTKKSHVFVFQDEREWRQFLVNSKSSLGWAVSFAYGDELFLNVGGATERLDSTTIAHEATHAVLARLYPEERWPLWLNEGFAEYVGAASVAARKGVTLGTQFHALPLASIPVETLVATTQYPANREDIPAFYQSSERLVRFLMSCNREKIAPFAEALIQGTDFKTAVVETYGFADYADFQKRFDKFTQ